MPFHYNSITTKVDIHTGCFIKPKPKVLLVPRYLKVGNKIPIDYFPKNSQVRYLNGCVERY